VHRDADAHRAMSVLVDGNTGSGFLPRVEAQVDGNAACSRPPWASRVAWLRRGGGMPRRPPAVRQADDELRHTTTGLLSGVLAATIVAARRALHLGERSLPGATRR
jgi:hypothetical protein